MKFNLSVGVSGIKEFATTDEVREYLDRLDDEQERAGYVKRVRGIKYAQIAISGDSVYEPCEWNFGIPVKFSRYERVAGTVDDTDLDRRVVGPVTVLAPCPA